MSEAATLRAAARDPNKSVHEVLCKAQEVAVTFKVECPAWIQHELDGYPDVSELPKYRYLRAQIKVWDGMAWAPVLHPHHPELTEQLKAVPVLQSASSIERIALATPADDSMSPVPDKLAVQLMSHFKRKAEFVLATHTSEFARCVDGIRTRVHSWALTLPEPQTRTALAPEKKTDWLGRANGVVDLWNKLPDGAKLVVKAVLGGAVSIAGTYFALLQKGCH